MKDEVKFCIHISGRDDFIPVSGIAEAVRASAFLNAQYLDFYQSRSDADLNMIPYCFATPYIWDCSPQSHEIILKKLEEFANTYDCPHWMVG